MVMLLVPRVWLYFCWRGLLALPLLVLNAEVALEAAECAGWPSFSNSLAHLSSFVPHDEMRVLEMSTLSQETQARSSGLMVFSAAQRMLRVVACESQPSVSNSLADLSSVSPQDAMRVSDMSTL
jgi:hypothetical protein